MSADPEFSIEAKAMTARAKTLFLLTLTAALGACGGGGGGGGSATASTGFAKISTDNAPAISAAVVDSALESGEIGDLVESAPLVAIGGINGLGKTGIGMLGKLGSTPAAGPAAWYQAMIGPIKIDCAVNGSVTLSGEQTDPTAPSAGDRFGLIFDKCDDGAGEVIDGGFEFVVTSIDGNVDTGEFAMSVSMTVSGLSVTGADGTEFVDGKVDIGIDTSEPPVSSITVSGETLTIGENSVTRSLADFATHATLDNSIAPAAYAIESAGSVMSSEFDGEIVYSTPVTFQGSGDEYPYAGEFLITGDAGASIRLIAMDNVKVRLLIDEDGDGAEDFTIETTWDAIRN